MTLTTDRPGPKVTADQAKVVDHAGGPLLVLGGPGTGKTTLLTERFVRLALGETGSPDRILFLVPNRAQKIELQNRLTERLLFDEGLEALIEVPVYTWHGFAYHLVSRHYKRLDYPEPPVLLTSPEQWGDIRDELAGENEADWPHHHDLLGTPAFVDEVVDFCIRAEQRLLGEEDLTRLVGARPDYEEVVRFYVKHRRRLRSGARVDYPTLLEDAVWLLANHDDVRNLLHERYPHVLVDEAQELSVVQQRMLRFLAGDGDRRSLVVAADPDSAIETFRGAEPDWLKNFGAEYEGHQTIVLSTTHRLGPGLAGSAISMVERANQAMHRPTTFAGESTLDVRRYGNFAAEADAAARELRLAHLREGIAFEDMAVLLTSPSAMLPTLERALQGIEVPYSISVPDRPLEREPAVRAFKNLADFAFGDSEQALVELLRSPLGGLKDRHIRLLERAARVAGVTLASLVEDISNEIDEEVQTRLRGLLELRDVLRSKQQARADEAFWSVWEKAAYYRHLRERALGNPEDSANREVDALVAFARALGRFVERRRGTATLSDYLQALGRADFGADPWLPPERARGGVQILSFHAAKGKQWAVVVVAGCIEGLIPKGRRARGLFDPYFLDEQSPVERARRNDAEDRRVFFVALTRASRRCIVTTSPGPGRRGQPSRFLAELIGREPETEPLSEGLPVTLSEAAGRLRRTISDQQAAGTERVAALAGLVRIRALDPACAAADPKEWWWRWDWTEGAVPIKRQAEDDDAGDGLRTSYSRISQYDNCGLAYLFSVVLGLDPDSSHNMAFGSLIHQIFEDCERDPTPEQKAQGRRYLPDTDSALKRYEEAFKEIESVFPNAAISRQFRRDGARMIERYFKHMKPGQAVLAEHPFTVDFEGHRIRGRIDRVEQLGPNVVVKDYKTSRNPVYYDEARSSLQLAIYYLAAQSDPAIADLGEVRSMQLVYPGHTTDGKPTVRAQKPEEAQVVLEGLPTLIKGVLDEDFRPKTDADCKWCKFKPLCPLWPEGKELPV